MKCLIVDDQPFARELAAKYVAEIPGLELMAACEGPISTLKVLQNQQVDLLLLDIEMPGLTGYELLKSLQHPPLVIVISGHAEFALEGYRWDIVDFILKPLSLEKLVMAVKRAKEKMTKKPALSEAEGLRHFFIRQEHKMLKLRLSSILFIESYREYVHIHTKAQKYVIKKSLTALEAKLPPNEFKRVHRSFIVCLDSIDGWYGNVLQLENHEVPIGKSYRDDLLKLLESI